MPDNPQAIFHEIEIMIEDQSLPSWVKTDLFYNETGVILSANEMKWLDELITLTEGNLIKLPRRTADLAEYEDGSIALDEYIDPAYVKNLKKNNQTKYQALQKLFGQTHTQHRPGHSVIYTDSNRRIALFHNAENEGTGISSALGDGVTSEVRLGQDLDDGSIVAVKVLRRSKVMQTVTEPKKLNATKEAAAESEMIAQLGLDRANPDDPNAPKLGSQTRITSDANAEEDEKYYIVQTYAPGEELFKYLDARQVMVKDDPDTLAYIDIPLKSRAEIAKKAVIALQALHEKQILCRDFKTENVRLHISKNGTLSVKIVDVGSLVQLKPNETVFDGSKFSLRGTLEFTAPESAKISFVGDSPIVDRTAPDCLSKQYTKASDIYAFGGMLQILFTDLISDYRKNNYAYYDAPFDVEEGITKNERPDLVQLIDIITACVSPKMENRPSLPELILQMEKAEALCENYDRMATQQKTLIKNLLEKINELKATIPANHADKLNAIEDKAKKIQSNTETKFYKRPYFMLEKMQYSLDALQMDIQELSPTASATLAHNVAEASKSSQNIIAFGRQQVKLIEAEQVEITDKTSGLIFTK